eukprot:CAMPEP_0115310278 /NCGR_PEP_ID=MMETSP0270-20121206/74714_1 /TAXON_ID=71861 /ORGANISM="Scrippsiella trochoidea, Strain CCMP3099" /LENGTH=103 /DNA_ID=CAMNT_0002729027 /DNA_START=259 /DNA_END=570 /DNA_ORIENTATION=-
MLEVKRMHQEVPHINPREASGAGVRARLQEEAALVVVGVTKAEHSGEEGALVEVRGMRPALAGEVPANQDLSDGRIRAIVPFPDEGQDAVFKDRLQQPLHLDV